MYNDPEGRPPGPAAGGGNLSDDALAGSVDVTSPETIEAWREAARRTAQRDEFVVVYDEGVKGEEVESYYGFFSSVEQAKSQYAMLASGESYHDAKVCRVVEVLPDVEAQWCGNTDAHEPHADGPDTAAGSHEEGPDCRIVACPGYTPDLEDMAMEAENRWQNGRRDPESWRERGQEADEPPDDDEPMPADIDREGLPEFNGSFR